MRELLVDTCERVDTESGTLQFDYYIIIDQMEVEHGFACESYGVKIADRDAPSESVIIPHITTSISRIDELMELLIRNFVTPVTAMDVIEDWL